MEETSDLQNPYAHMTRARALEEAENLRGAETEWRSAVRSADSLPLVEYKKTLQVELLHYQVDPAYESQPGVSEASVRHAYSEVLSLPFITRLELASFYARYCDYAEANQVCEESFAVLPESECLKDPRVNELYQRGQLMKQSLEQAVGDPEMERIFAENFSKLDRDGNGYVHHSELEQAQFDLTLSQECQMLIRHLLARYFQVEAAHNDEVGIDIKGISQRDMKAYATRSNASWKKLSKDEDSPGPHHMW
jgi:hypothetical protein